MTKVCTKCGVEKDIESYYKDSRGSNGRYSRCKECVNLEKKEYRQREEVKEMSRKRSIEYRKSHLEEARAYQRSYGKEYRKREDIKEKNKARMSEYRKTDAYKQSQLKHYEKHRVKAAEKRKTKIQLSPDCIKQKEREWYAKNKEHINKRKRKARSEKLDLYRQTNRLWYEKNKDKIKEAKKHYRIVKGGDWFAGIMREYRKRNPEIFKRKDAERIEKITDGYVINMIASNFGLSAAERKLIPKDMIEIKRINIKLKRELKKINNDKD